MPKKNLDLLYFITLYLYYIPLHDTLHFYYHYTYTLHCITLYHIYDVIIILTLLFIKDRDGTLKI